MREICGDRLEGPGRVGKEFGIRENRFTRRIEEDKSCLNLCSSDYFKKRMRNHHPYLKEG